MPTSVLLAVLAAAGLLALAPALVRRYDATERLVAERALSTARVLARAGARTHRRRRTVPGRRPVNPPRAVVARLAGGQPVLAAGQPVPAGAAAGAPGDRPAGAPGDRRPGAPGGASGAGTLPAGRGSAAGGRVSDSSPTGGQAAGSLAAGRVAGSGVVGSRVAGSGVAGALAGGSAPLRRTRPPLRLRHPRAVYRRRRVFAALLLLNLVELVGVVVVGPGFWISAAVSGALLGAYLVHLRNRAVAEQARRREEARYAAWIAARQAAVRRGQARRAAARREALRRQLVEREQARRAAARLAAQNALRGRPYETRGRAVNE